MDRPVQMDQELQQTIAKEVQRLGMSIQAQLQVFTTTMTADIQALLITREKAKTEPQIVTGNGESKDAEDGKEQ